MPLITDPATGAHTFIPDTNALPQLDIDSLNNPRQTRGQVRPLERGGWYEEPLGPAYPGGYYFRWNINEGRGDFLQDGYVEDYAGERSIGDMVWDKPGMARQPFKTELQTGPAVTTLYGDRAHGANFRNTPLIILPEVSSPHLYKDNGDTYTPNIVAVTGFTAPAGANVQLCMEAVQINGTPALLIGWSSASVNALQVLTDLANPPTSSTVPVGPVGVFGICQVGIDGNSIQVYTADASGGKIVMFNTNVALGSATFVDRARLPGGGYTVGLANIGYNPAVYYVVPDNGLALLNPPLVSAGFDPPTFRGRLVQVDLRAFEVHDVTIALDFVLYATKTKYGIFYCNGHQHQYMTQGSDYPVDQLIDFPANSNRVPICRGHWCIDDQVFWRVNQTDAATNTLGFTLKFDEVLRTVTSVGSDQDLGAQGLQSFGGPRLPYSDLSRTLIDWAKGNWYFQHQPRSSELGWNDRHTVDSVAGTGRPFEASCSFWTPRLRSRRHPRAKFVVRRETGPTLRNLREGGTDATSKITVAVTAQPTVEFRADESSVFVDRRPVAQEIFDGNDSWTYELQAIITAYQGTGGTNGSGEDAGRMSGNYAPVTIEGFFFDEPLGPQSIPTLAEMKSWDNAA